MKCIKKGEEIKRVDDLIAVELVKNESFSYCKKEEWKEKRVKREEPKQEALQETLRGEKKKFRKKFRRRNN